MTSSGPPTAQVAKGEVLHRVHAVSHGARFYGRRDAPWRWDDPAGGYGVLYLGRTPVGPFAETLLRRPEQRTLIWSEVAKRRLARFRLAAPLLLAGLYGKGISWFGVTIARIAADHDGITYPGTYADTQTISALVHEHTGLDGIQYRSRFDPDHLCIALFDRADRKIELVEEDGPISRAWVDDLLQPRGKLVVDL